MKRCLALSLLATIGGSLFCLSALAQSPQRPNPMLHQQGAKIVDGLGKEVKLRGVNLGGWLLWEGWIFGKGILTSETTILTRLTEGAGMQETRQFQRNIHDNFIAEADIQKIALAGFNVVRVPLNHRLFQDDAAWKVLDRLLVWCEKYKVYVILDLHAIPGGQSGLGMADPGDARHQVWVSEENQKQAVAVWKSIATRYRNRKIIAGYDLINEPAPPSGEALVDLYQRIIPVIRAVDPDHLILIEGSKCATDFSMFEKPLCQNQAFSFHMYTWFGDDRKKNLAAYRAFAQRQNAPLWVGEFGENSYAMIRSTVEMYDECPEINGWVFWTWKKAPNKFPGLVTMKLPGDWIDVLEWVGSLFGGGKPEPVTIRAGMREFIAATKLKYCNYDERMQHALLPKK
jgi:hypothetical protein